VNRGCIDHCLEFEEHWKKEVADGKVTMDYEATPAVRPEQIIVFICLTHTYSISGYSSTQPRNHGADIKSLDCK
jgi:hypothetical protein